MTWIDDNKGEGPWPFTPQPDKPNYNEGDLIAPHTDPIWKDKFFKTHVGAETVTPEHFPWCGYWLKDYVPGDGLPPVEMETEIYFELLKSEVAEVFSGVDVGHGPHIDHLPSKIDLDIDDFDGDLTWEFEAIWCNLSANVGKLQVVDQADNIYAEMELATGLSGPTNRELFRTRVDFTPGTGNRTYMLRFVNQGNEFPFWPLSVVIGTARIVLRQKNASKTKIQIPMFSSRYAYALQDYEYPGGSYGIGWNVYDNQVGGYGDDWSDALGGSSNPARKHIMSKMGATIWKYDQSELNKLSKIIFNVDAEGGAPSSLTGITQDLATSLEITYFRFMLYWAPFGSSTLACNNATPAGWTSQTQVHTDGCTGAVFTPIPGSYLEWDKTIGSYPYTLECEPDFTSVPHDALIFTGGEIRLAGAGEQPWCHFNKFFDNPATATRAIMDEKLTIYSKALNNQQGHTFNYRMWSSKEDLTVALWNVTTDSLVPGSELVWEFEEEYSRKEVEILSGNFSSECEYKIVAKAPGYQFTQGIAPYIYDAQLLLNIDPISKLTIWQRVTHSYSDLWDNWSTPSAWNNSEVGSRIKLLITAGTKAYFEHTAYQAEEWHDYESVFLEDMGADDSSGSGSGGSDVTGGELQWPKSEWPNVSRKRSGELTLTNGNVYNNRQPGNDLEAEDLNIGTGFIVLKVVS